MNRDWNSIITKYQKMTKVSKNLQKNNSEKVINENDKEIPRERYISLEKRLKIIDNLVSVIII